MLVSGTKPLICKTLRGRGRGRKWNVFWRRYIYLCKYSAINIFVHVHVTHCQLPYNYMHMHMHAQYALAFVTRCQACSSIGEHICGHCSPHVEGTGESYQHYCINLMYFIRGKMKPGKNEAWETIMPDWAGKCVWWQASARVCVVCVHLIHLNVIIFHSGKGSRFTFYSNNIGIAILESPSCWIQWIQVPGNKFSCLMFLVYKVARCLLELCTKQVRQVRQLIRSSMIQGLLLLQIWR